MPTLYLIPTPLGETTLEQILPQGTLQYIKPLEYFIVEKAKTARQFLKQVTMPIPMEAIHIEELNTRTDAKEFLNLLAPAIKEGKDMGLLSEAGCPAVADPGAEIVKLAHKHNIKVVPLVGASSILMAVMASGMSGQNFAFWGYLPIQSADKKRKLQYLERQSEINNQTQLFIETPYRNDTMLKEMISTLKPSTYIGVATDLTLPTEFTKTMTVEAWKKQKALPDLHKRPTVFSLMA